MNIDEAKIMVFTVDAWNDQIGANTMCSLFSWCKPENLANVYIRPQLPTVNGCNHYFQIDEYLVIRSIIDNRLMTGRIVTFSDQQDQNNKFVGESIYRKFKNYRPWTLLFLREMFWKIGNWKTDALDSFIDDFSPDIIIAPYEGYIHFNRIVRYAVNRSGANFFGFFWDDNFTYRQQPWNLGYRLYRWFQRRDIRSSVILSNGNFAITPKTKSEADATFKISCKILTKPIENFVEPKLSDFSDKFPIKIVYTGNLGIGRLGTIFSIGQILDSLNLNNKKIELHIYTNTTILDKERRKLGNSIVIHGSIPQKEVNEVQRTADILLFVEAINGKYSKIARLSLSTKITDYLASGKCIMAVARRDIAPIEYLAEHDAAIIATNMKEMYEYLVQIVNNKNILYQYAKNAWRCAVSYHSFKFINRNLSDSLVDGLKMKRGV